MAIEFAAERRSELGKSAGKRLRREGRLPGNLYGAGVDGSISISLDRKLAEKAIFTSGKHGEYSISLDGRSYAVKLQEVQVEPIRKELVHLDLLVTNG